VGLAFTAWLWFRFKLNYRVDLFSAGFQEKKMNEEIEKQNPAHETDNRENASASVDGVNQSRRRFGLAGLAAPAVMLSLASKPVMGASYWCTGSGGMSGNTSGHGTKLSCLACSPGYWKTSPGTWPKPYYPYDICIACSSGGSTKKYSATTFYSVFGSAPSGGSSSTTMMWVLRNMPGSLAFHTVGALLNAATAAAMGLTSAYTVAEVINMYKAGKGTSTLASTFSSTWEGSMENCSLANSNDNWYRAESGTFMCNVVTSSGVEQTPLTPFKSPIKSHC
jgi:hypothetical protein